VERRHEELMAALAKIADGQAAMAKRVQNTASQVESMISRGVMVVPPGRTWEKKSAFLIPTGKSPRKGPDDAPVRVVEFADFQCPYCRANAGLADTLLAEFPDELQFVFKHYPLTRKHENAEPAARASVAAAKQGKFWEMHDRLFSSGRLGPEDLREHAQAVGLNMKVFDRSMSSPVLGIVVKRDRALARDLGVSGTPTFFVNGKRVDGATHESVASAIRAELRQLDKDGKRPDGARLAPGGDAKKDLPGTGAAPGAQAPAAQAPPPQAPAPQADGVAGAS
jgi:protein-disulfide isomerase